MLAQSTRDTLDHLSAWFSTEHWRFRWEQHQQGTIDALSNILDLDQDFIVEKAEPDGWHLLLMRTMVERFAEHEFEAPPFNVTDDFLKRRGWNESKAGCEYLNAIRHSVFSIYEILEVQPGKGLLVQDTLRPYLPCFVCEVSASQQLKPMEHLFAKLTQVSGQYHFTGSVFRLRKGQDIQRIEEIRQTISEKGLSLEDLSHENLSQISRIVGSFWLTLLADGVGYMLYPIPELCNVEGHRMILAEILWPVIDADAVIRTLNSLSEEFDPMETEEDPLWNWLLLPDAVTGKRNTVYPTDENRASLRGSVILTSYGLKGFTDSKERTEALTARWKALFPDALKQPVVAYQTLNNAVKQYSKKRNATRPSTRLTLTEERELVHAQLDRHYHWILDNPIPLLKNQSPRDAINHAEGKKLVTRWLLDLEASNSGTTGGMAGYDFSWMWPELGLAKP